MIPTRSLVSKYAAFGVAAGEGEGLIKRFIIIHRCLSSFITWYYAGLSIHKSLL